MTIQQEAKRILIVEDEPTLADVLCRALRSRLSDEYQIESCGHAEEAMARLQHQTFELLIADLRMSGMNGLDLIRRTRQVSPQTHTMLITAYLSPEVQDQADLLATTCLFKPFGMTEFVGAVKRALDGRLKA